MYRSGSPGAPDDTVIHFLSVCCAGGRHVGLAVAVSRVVTWVRFSGRGTARAPPSPTRPHGIIALASDNRSSRAAYLALRVPCNISVRLRLQADEPATLADVPLPGFSVHCVQKRRERLVNSRCHPPIEVFVTRLAGY